MIRPGPETITAEACPGGVVVHVYRLDPDGVPVLLMVRCLGPNHPLYEVRADADADGHAAADMAEGLLICVVAYDGDTGHRYTPAAWRALGVEGGRFLG